MCKTFGVLPEYGGYATSTPKLLRSKRGYSAYCNSVLIKKNMTETPFLVLFNC